MELDYLMFRYTEVMLLQSTGRNILKQSTDTYKVLCWMSLILSTSEPACTMLSGLLLPLALVLLLLCVAPFTLPPLVLSLFCRRRFTACSSCSKSSPSSLTPGPSSIPFCREQIQHIIFK